MIRGILVGLTMVSAVASAATVGIPTPAAKASREVLRRCGAGEAQFASAPDADWTPAKSVNAQHTALRHTLGEPMPSAGSMVSIHAIGGDLATTEFSVILARSEDGIWRGTAVGQSKIWVSGATPSITPRRAWTLSKERGNRLDELLADKCFYAEPTSFHRDQAPGIGALIIDLETQTPSHQRRVSYIGDNVKGLTKEVTELAYPPET